MEDHKYDLQRIFHCVKIRLKIILWKSSLDSKIFRPPYGKIKSIQAKKLQHQGYKIIMWDVLSADFDQTITKKDA
jgi:hypothetical protein